MSLLPVRWRLLWVVMVGGVAVWLPRCCEARTRRGWSPAHSRLRHRGAHRRHRQALAQEYHDRGSEALEEHHYLEAIKNYKDAIKLEPKATEHYYGLALSQSGLEHYADAIQALQRILKLQPRDDRAYGYLAYMYESQGRYAEELTAARQAASLRPESPTHQITLGQAYEDNDQWLNAIAAYRRAATLDPTSTEALTALGDATLHTGRFTEAIKALERALQLEKNDPSIYGMLGYCYEATGEFETGIIMYDAALYLEPKDTTYLFYRSVGHLCQWDGAGAVADARRCLDLEGWKGLYSQAVAMTMFLAYRMLGQQERADAISEAALAHVADFRQAVQKADQADKRHKTRKKDRDDPVLQARTWWRYLRHEITLERVAATLKDIRGGEDTVGLDLEIAGKLPDALKHYQIAHRDREHNPAGYLLAVAGIRRLTQKGIRVPSARPPAPTPAVRDEGHASE